MEYQKVPLTCDPLLKGYEIDTNGIVYGKKGKSLHPSKPGHSMLVNFTIKGKSITRQVHRLVAKQFIPNPNHKPTVNHIDGNTRNNCVANLEWATQKEQMIHARDVLGKQPTNKIPIVGLNIKTKEIVEFPSCTSAARYFSVVKSSIELAVVGKRKSSCGYVWIGKSNDYNADYSHLNEKIASLHSIRTMGRRVGRFSKDGILIETYRNACSTREYGFSHKTVYKCCINDGIHKTYKGFIWKFLDD